MCALTQLVYPYCRPYNNRQAVQCVAGDGALVEGWSACGKFIGAEVRHYGQFVVRIPSNPVSECAPGRRGALGVRLAAGVPDPQVPRDALPPRARAADAACACDAKLVATMYYKHSALRIQAPGP